MPWRELIADVKCLNRGRRGDEVRQAPDRRHRRDEVGKRLTREQVPLRRQLDSAAAGVGHVAGPDVDGPLGAAPQDEPEGEDGGEHQEPPDPPHALRWATGATTRSGDGQRRSDEVPGPGALVQPPAPLTRQDTTRDQLQSRHLDAFKKLEICANEQCTYCMYSTGRTPPGADRRPMRTSNPHRMQISYASPVVSGGQAAPQLLLKGINLQRIHSI